MSHYVIESIGFLLDRLVISNLKCHQMNHRQIEIEKMENPSNDDHIEHTRLARSTRIVNEERVALKNAIDTRLHAIIASGEYIYTSEERTYQLGKEIDDRIAESVKEQYENTSDGVRRDSR